MATLSAIASNLLETIGLAQPRMEVMVREDTEGTMELHPLRMQRPRGGLPWPQGRSGSVGRG